MMTTCANTDPKFTIGLIFDPLRRTDPGMTMITTRIASKIDAPQISRMLKGLAGHLGFGDAFVSDPQTILQHGFGDRVLFHCVIAEHQSDAIGLALFFPYFSTYRGQPGAYVQDLLVDPKIRGQSVGQQLLAHVADFSARSWQSNYIALAVHVDNHDATRFYERLGFCENRTDRPFFVEDVAFNQLRSLFDRG